MELVIGINVAIGGQEFHLCETRNVNTEEWDIEGVANEALELLTFRMKSAIAPCFWENHSKNEVEKYFLPEEDK